MLALPAEIKFEKPFKFDHQSEFLQSHTITKILSLLSDPEKMIPMFQATGQDVSCFQWTPEFLYSLAPPATNGADWDWSRVGNNRSSSLKQFGQGKLTKRIQQWYWKVRKLKLSDDILTEIGNIVGTDTASMRPIWFLDFTKRFDWNDGDFGDDGSCFWHSRSYGLDVLYRLNAFAIRTYTDETFRQGLGRAWIVPVEKAGELIFAVFNGYEAPKRVSNQEALPGGNRAYTFGHKYSPAQTRDFANVFSAILDLPFVSGQLLLDGNFESPLYINNAGIAYFVGSKDALQLLKSSPRAIPELDIHFIRNPNNYRSCAYCRTSAWFWQTEFNEFHEVNGNWYCADHPSHCHACGQIFTNDQPQHYVQFTRKYTQAVCEKCYNAAIASGEYHECANRYCHVVSTNLLCREHTSMYQRFEQSLLAGYRRLSLDRSLLLDLLYEIQTWTSREWPILSTYLPLAEAENWWNKIVEIAPFPNPYTIHFIKGEDGKYCRVEKREIPQKPRAEKSTKKNLYLNVDVSYNQNSSTTITPDTFNWIDIPNNQENN